MENNNSFTGLLSILNKNWKLILVLPIIVGLLTLFISVFLVKPKYEANTQVLVNQKEKNNQVMAQEVQGNIQLINTYSEILKSPRIIDKVAKDENISSKNLNNMISIETKANSQILNINVKNSEEKTTERIANKIAETFKNKMPDIMNINNVSILSKADGTAKQTSPNVILNSVIGVLIGLVLAVLLVGLKQVMDKRIKDEEDVDNELNLPVLGSINKLK